MPFQLFEMMRRERADWYTANPLEMMSDEDLAGLAEDAGMTVEELRAHAAAPHVEMTCPLCGRPQTHLVNCKGCGGDAWGWEFGEAHGEDAADRLRQRLETFLAQGEHFTPDQVQHAVKHAYGWGGCQVCSICWHHTLPAEAYLICPLNLQADLALNPGPPRALFFTLMETPEERRRQAVQEWAGSVWAHWTDHWNTIPAGPEHDAVAEWRAGLLCAALVEAPPETKRTYRETER